jgi:hypothetical protein
MSPLFQGLLLDSGEASVPDNGELCYFFFVQRTVLYYIKSSYFIHKWV